ncbi:hypothetical protein [Hymenobacter sp. BT730]|uniref:hypothetical protein n=1 Tax=Hymenobacter sp. BT730 TaxID=3063332 RepID=UPI0026DF9AF6|nr:hypothetical protein [Hymenobacter sp. BT730]
MRHRVLYQLDFLTLEYDVVEEYLHAVWRGEQTDETIREGYEQILQALGHERCARLLDNHYAIQGIWVSQADWLAHDWYPRAVEAGLRYHAVVYSQDFYSRRSTQEAIAKIPGGLVAAFHREESAKQALLAL